MLRVRLNVDAALERLRAEGHDVRDEDVVRLSPLGFAHINMLGRYAFTLPGVVARGELCPLRDPASASDAPDSPDAGVPFRPGFVHKIGVQQTQNTRRVPALDAKPGPRRSAPGFEGQWLSGPECEKGYGDAALSASADVPR